MDLTVLFIGNRNHAEFHSAWKSLVPLARIVPADDLTAALELLGNGLAADVIVIAQERPGQFDAGSIDDLRRAAPVAPVAGLLSSWCAGDVRRGFAWPGVARVTWDRWECDALPGFQQLLGGECPSWALAATASDEERHLHKATVPLPRGRGKIAIHAQNRAMRNWLTDACAAGGYQPIALPCNAREGGSLAREPSERSRVVRAVIWDCPGECADDAALWKHWSQQLNDAPVLLLQNFPRPETHVWAEQARVAAVLAKPLGVSDLLAELDTLVNGGAGRQEAAGRRQ